MALQGSQIDLNDCVTLLNAAVVAAALGYDVKVGCADDVDYTAKFGKVFPAIWVAGNDTSARDNGAGLAEKARQNFNSQVLVIPMAQKIIPGASPQIRVGIRIAALETIIMQALFAMQVPGAKFPFSIARWGNGPNNEVYTSRIMIFATQLTYQR